MEQADWEAWVARHATVFGFTDMSVRMLISWQAIFDKADYTAEELHAATTAMAIETQARYPANHLQAIHAAIREQRAVDFRKDEKSADDQCGCCIKCSGPGRVIVPHILGIKDGKWVAIRTTRRRSTFFMMAVLCDCREGRNHGARLAYNRNGEARQMMTLANYEKMNPDWRQQESRRMQELRTTAESMAQSESSAVTEDFERAVQRLKGMIGKTPE